VFQIFALVSWIPEIVDVGGSMVRRSSMIWVAVIAPLGLAVGVRELALRAGVGEALAVRDGAELGDELMAAGADVGETAVTGEAGPSAGVSRGTIPVVPATMIAVAARTLPAASKARWR